MKYKGIIIVFWLMAGIAECVGQDVSHQVLAPLASTADLSYYNVSQTVGEAMVLTLETSGHDLTQGFHQPGIFISTPEQPKGNGVEVYPNPVVDKMKVELFGHEKRDFEIVIFGLNGSVFYRSKVSCGPDYWKIISLNMNSYKRGMYFVRVISLDNKISRLFKIEKM